MCKRSFRLRLFLLCAFSVLLGSQSFAQQAGRLEGRTLYDALRKFELKGKASVTGLALKRDRAEMVFNGDFYFAAPVNGRITGAVFLGNGTFRAPAPGIQYEKEVMMRFINAEVAESDFQSAVLRFSDDTFDLIGKNADMEAAPPAAAQTLAAELEGRLLKETGANISSRILISLVNGESPGFFLAQFDKGRHGRFTFMLDPQTRIPGGVFDINAGEKVMLFSYAPYSYTNDVWIATYSEEDFKKGRSSFSDQYDLVAPINYNIEVDLRDPRDKIRTRVRIDMESAVDNLRIIPMVINESLTEYDNFRIKHSMRILSAKFEGQDLPFVQEEWESGITLLLPKAMQKGAKFTVDLDLEGDFIDNQRVIESGYYPLENSSWYPRHGYLKRSTFTLTFRHRKNDQVSSVGKLIREEEWPDDKNSRLTEFRMDHPISFATFAAGMLERHTENRKLIFGELPLEFYSVPSSVGRIKESFILTEMGNALNFFSDLFGAYPYKDFRATFHPFNFGQGFPTMLLIPRADEANRDVFNFIAHETSHQWWGNVVAWRSYRDQWLSEGFAEYSGMLYTARRESEKATRDLIKTARFHLPFPPMTDTGAGKGKMAEMGPLILGHRLNTRMSQGAYQTLIYDKGALVLRMLHFLFSDPNTGDGKAFFQMMTDFAKRFENKAASTEDFAVVAGAHFANTPIAKVFGLKDLNWFFQQWVFEAKLPSYRMEYKIDTSEGGEAVLTGTVIQENAGANWFMPLPVVCKFGNKGEGRSLVYANGPQTPFKVVLPMKPSSVELDPELWILSEKTTTKKQ